MSTRATDINQKLYRTADYTRPRFGDNERAAASFYQDFLRFVMGCTPPGGSGMKDLLDVGCGGGWSTHCFAGAGYRATGVDLNPDAFEVPQADNLQLREGNALALPFEASSFDVVASYQCLEHIPDPQRALDEMMRVCRPDGVVCIVGPNLLSPFLPLKFTISEVLSGTLKLRRDPSMPLGPYGNTLAEHVVKTGVITRLLVGKLCSSRVAFTMRTPDTVPPFDADNDACYLCNPTDLTKYFRQRGYRVLRSGRPGRPPGSYLFAGGTWVAARKGLHEAIRRA
jgi:SAM-dependent methyltransferase